MAKTDPLERLNGLAVCPVCGCFDRRGMYRCSECGTFHAGAIMEDREPPAPSEQLLLQQESNQPLDPSVYSLGPNAAIPEETFDESEDVRHWDGGSTDFTFEDDDPPVAKMELPAAEDIHAVED